jgi:hypothetical protein
VPALANVLLRNWPLKLAALALSIIVWVIIASEETTSALVPVQLELEVPASLALSRPLPAVRVLVIGPGRELIKLYASPPVVRAVVPAGATPPRWRLAVAPSDIQIPRNAKVSIQDVEPRDVEVEIDRMVRRSVPVALRGVVEPESGFALSGVPALSPAEVRVSGPRALVFNLDSVRTESFELRGLTAPVEQRILLDTAAHPMLHIVPREVTVTARVRRS